MPSYMNFRECSDCGAIGADETTMRCHRCDRIAELEAALRAIYEAADSSCDDQDWADRVSAAMTDERRNLVTE